MATHSVNSFANFLQLAYITRDFDAGLLALHERHGIRDMLQMRDTAVEVGPQRYARLHVGLAYVGEIQIELIEPVGGEDAVYRWGLPTTAGALHLHHIAQQFATLDELESIEAELIRKDVRIVLRGGVPGMIHYFYSDRRATLGHVIEHVHYTPEGRQFLATLPRA